MKKKLIEVALPLEAINKAAAKEKSVRHGHPSTLHLWWARRPLAACRAVLFASLVDDPSGHRNQFPTEEDQERERQRLFHIIERLVLWENVNNQAVLNEAKAEILKSTGGKLPAIYDPFCGGGSIPLEAQRLGLEAHASDLNPVAVLITKALIEIPPKFANRSPTNPEARKKGLKDSAYPGARGLAEDVRYYGGWMRQRAHERIGHLYPPVKSPDRTEATVIAWLWARTVKCPNPACQAEMFLVRSFELSKKDGKAAWVEPEIDHSAKTVRFKVHTGRGKVPVSPKTGRGANFRCLVCEQLAPDAHIKSEGQAGRMGARLMAIVAEGERGRIYVEPNQEHEQLASATEPAWAPEQELAYDPRNIWCVQYGLTRFRDLFARRQLVALSTFSDLIAEAWEQSITDGASQERASAIATYLAFAVDKASDRNTSLCAWESKMDRMRGTFGRQALPMVWDYAETNPFAGAGGDLSGCVESLCEALEVLQTAPAGVVRQLDAVSLVIDDTPMVFSTDPPYYDNIGYADLSDFFYVWLRRSIGTAFPEIFSTLLVPKKQELVATPYRFGGSKEQAQEFFQDGFGKAFQRMRNAQHNDYPLTVYYAFKQSEVTPTKT